VVMLRSNGRVLTDVTVADDDVIVPPGTRLVAVQSDPATAPDTTPDPATGPVVGWHVRSRLAQVGARSALGAGCVVRTNADRATVTRAAEDTAVVRTGWVEAHDAIAGAATVTTTFAEPATVVGLVFDDVIPADLDTLSVGFGGSRRAGEPTVVIVGSQSVVVVAVTMDDDVAARRKLGTPAFTVDVTAGGSFRLAGVLAADGTVDGLAERLATDGVDGVTGRLLGTTGPGCSIEWRKPTRTRRMPAEARRGG
jgi:hypothetical protein